MAELNLDGQHAFQLGAGEAYLRFVLRHLVHTCLNGCLG